MGQREGLPVHLQTGFCSPPGFLKSQEAFACGPPEFSHWTYIEFTRSGPLQLITKEGPTPMGPHLGPMNTGLSIINNKRAAWGIR